MIPSVCTYTSLPIPDPGDQKWYAFNDMMVYRAMDTLAKFLGPKEFTQQQLY